jgi:uncharacterized membrane protein YkvA (DUF1232 family)
MFAKILSQKLPAELDTNLKSLINQMYQNSIINIGTEEISYIENKIYNKLNCTLNSGTLWVREMSSCYSLLFNALLLYKENQIINISSQAHKYIAAALFYFINPFDIIPDYTPVTGYLDDLYVLKLCLKSISNYDLRIIKEISSQ